MLHKTKRRVNKIKETFDSAKREWIDQNTTNKDKADAMALFDKTPLTMSRYFSKSNPTTDTGVLKFLEKRAEKNSGEKYQSSLTA